MKEIFFFQAELLKLKKSDQFPDESVKIKGVQIRYVNTHHHTTRMITKLFDHHTTRMVVKFFDLEDYVGTYYETRN